jgi:hypothetical protein
MKKYIKKIDMSEEIRAALQEEEGFEESISEEAFAEEKNKGKKLNKPFRTPGGPKKFSVYVKNEKGNVVKVNFGDPNMEIKRDNPARRKSFRARHNCSSPGPKTKAKYWSCKMWSKKPVSKVSSSLDHEEDIVEMMDESEAEISNHQYPDPGKAMEAAKKMGFSKIHTHKGSNGKTVYMPGPNHEALVKKLKEKGETKEESESKRGLWDNIRDKKKREGKNYRPAKPGDKDRPDAKSWKKAQKPKKKKKK